MRCVDSEHSPRPKRSARRKSRLALAGCGLAALLLLVLLLLQFPAVRGAANRALIRTSGDRASIDGRLGTTPT